MSFFTNIRVFLTEIMFLLLPVRYLKIYIYLSFLILIEKIKHIDIDKNKIELINLENIMHVHLHNQVLLLPEITLYNIWKKDIENSLIVCDGNLISIKQAIMNEQIFKNNTKYIVSNLYDNLPDLIKFKLSYYKPTLEKKIINEMSRIVVV